MENKKNNEDNLKTIQSIDEGVKEIKKILNNFIHNNVEIPKIQGLSDYDKIILANLESRITILEEEAEKYNMT